MSKKLLNERTIRKFMKLANIEPLADGFLNETGAGLASKGSVGNGTFSKQKDHRNTKMSVSTKHGTKTGTPVTKGPGLVKEQEDEFGEEEELEMGGDEEMLPPEDEEELPPEPEMGEEGMGEGDIESLVAAIADAIEDHTGVTVDVAGGEEEMDMGEPEMELPPEGEEGGEEDLPPEPEMGDEEEGDEVLEGFNMVDEDEVVNETFRRVKSRLRKMQKEERLLESLTNKIHKRLLRKKAPLRRR
jgi:hypothetical protein